MLYPRRFSPVFSAAVSATCLAVAAADAAAQETRQPTRQASNVDAHGKPSRPVAQPLTVDPKLETVLQTWGQRSARVRKLTGNHARFIYQKASDVERRGVGSFAFESPDRGMLKVLPAELKEGTVSKKIGANGEPLRVVADEPEKWVCDGEQILQMEVSLGEPQYSRVEIPPRMRGENIIQGPMPFLFGVSAEELKKRYRMHLGDRHTWQPETSAGEVHVVAYPLRKVDAQSWQRADVILDGRSFLPLVIRMMDGHDQWASETVYRFDPSTFEVNKRQWPWKANPFKPNLKGWTLIENHVADEEQMRRMAPPK